METCSVDSPYDLVIANERLGFISGGTRTGLSRVYAESGLLFCYKVKKAYMSMVKATMVIAAIRGYSTLYGFYNAGTLRHVLYSLGISGYVTKPINSKNISRVIKKIEIVPGEAGTRGEEGSATTTIIHEHGRMDGDECGD